MTDETRQLDLEGADMNEKDINSSQLSGMQEETKSKVKDVLKLIAFDICDDYIRLGRVRIKHEDSCYEEGKDSSMSTSNYEDLVRWIDSVSDGMYATIPFLVNSLNFKPDNMYYLPASEEGNSPYVFWIDVNGSGIYQNHMRAYDISKHGEKEGLLVREVVPDEDLKD